jgi:putative transcriptional regulator
MDPNFRRSVVFLASHDKEGSLGFILNRPTGKTIGELVEDNEELSVLRNVNVYIGGPVANNQLTVCVLEWDPAHHRLAVRHNIPASEAASWIGSPNVTVRAFIGYAGWGEGQLARELTQNSWILQTAGREILDHEYTSDAWRRILRGMGPWHQLMAMMPDDPSLN